MKTVLPRISVVVPSFNQAQYLRQCLDSIFSQDYPNLEVIVMDGGSTDGSLEIFRDYQERFFHFQSRQDMRVESLNEGLFKVATGEILTWLNTDDYWAPNILQEVANAISPREGRWLVCGRSTWVCEPGGQLYDHPFFGSRTHRQLVEFWKYGTIPQTSVFFHRSLMERSGRLSWTAGKIAFDYEYWLRMTKQPEVWMYFVDRVWSYTRLHDQAVSVSKHYQSHLDLEMASRLYWPKPFSLARPFWELGYWLSTDPNKPQQQKFMKQVVPRMQKARTERRHLQSLCCLAWVLFTCPRNLIRSTKNFSTRLPEFPLLALVCPYKRLRHRLAKSIWKQRGPLLHGVSQTAFNLHPSSLGAPPTQLIIQDHKLFRRPRIAVRFRVTVPDVRAGFVDLSCWLEDSERRVVGKHVWTIRPTGPVECSAAWSEGNSQCCRMILESKPSATATSNFYMSTIISNFGLKDA